MAYVSIKWGKSATYHLNYITKDRTPADEVQAHNCSVETASSDFDSVRAEHGQEGGNQILHVLQSFSATDSQKLDSTALNTIGKSLALENFPDHQFVVRTHTDTDQTHNHIVVNTVNSETGKKIENKRALIYRLQDSSDKLCKEHGLSIINRDAKERGLKLPYKAQQMVRAGKKSYLLDLAQKADVARSIATNFDEYRDVMGGFGIRVLVEDKNISYFYPGRERGKRGSKLGKPYGRSGLLEAFQGNDEKFSRNPNLKTRFINQSLEIRKHGMPKTPEGISKFTNLWNGKDTPWKYVDQSASVSRRQSLEMFRSDRELSRSFVPVEEIKKAKGNSIFEYCEKNKISLTKNTDGKTVFKGKEFVAVSEFEFKNNKNGTRGSLIDLVAAHRNLTILQAVSYINGSQRLLLLEQQTGELSHHYKSFHVPAPEKSNALKTANALQQIFRSKIKDSSMQASFSQSRIAEAGRSGGIWIFACDESHKNTLQHEQALFTFVSHGSGHNSYSLDATTELSIDLFLIRNPKVKQISFISSREKKWSPADIQFLEILKKKYPKFGIQIEFIENERSLQKSFEFGISHAQGKGDFGIGL